MPMFLVPATQPTDRNAASMVLLDERITYLIAGEPQNHLVQAHEAMKRKDNRVAAAELRIASDYLEVLSLKRSAVPNPDLSQCVSTLRDFAATVGEGQFIPPETINATFAQINRALAEHFREEVDAAMQNRQHVRAGYALRHCATSLREAVIWSAEKPNEGVLESTDDALKLASTLINESDDGSKKLSENPPGTQQATAEKIDERVRNIAGLLTQQIELLAQVNEAQPAAEKQPPRDNK